MKKKGKNKKLFKKQEVAPGDVLRWTKEAKILFKNKKLTEFKLELF